MELKYKILIILTLITLSLLTINAEEVEPTDLYNLNVPLDTEQPYGSYKIANKSNFRVIVPNELSCFLKPDSIDDGYKTCVVDVEYIDQESIVSSVNTPSLQLSFSNDNAINIEQQYSDTFSWINESDEENNLTYQKREFNSFGNVPVNMQTVNPFAIRYTFEIPKWESNAFNISMSKGAFNVEIDPTISACATINETGEYTQDQDIPSITNCIIIETQNVSYDCQGFQINTTDDYAIWLKGVAVGDMTNTTIKNCEIHDSNIGIYVQYADNSFFINNTINGSLSSSGVGISTYLSYDNIYENNTIFDYSTASGKGIYFGGGDDYSNISDNILINNNEGLAFNSHPTYNIIKNNIINDSTSSGIRIYDGRTDYNIFYNNYFSGDAPAISSIQGALNNYSIDQIAGTNIIGGSIIAGNYYSKMVAPDGNSDGIFDIGKSVQIRSSNYGVDFFPLSDGTKLGYEGSEECMWINESGDFIVSTSETDYIAPCHQIEANHVLLDWNNTYFDGTDQGIQSGILVTGGSSNITIKNLNLNDVGKGVDINTASDVHVMDSYFSSCGSSGISFSTVTESTFNNITVFGSADGIYSVVMSYNNFTNIIVNQSTDDGMDISTSSDFNIFENITIINPADDGFVLYTADSNILNDITITDNSGVGDKGLYVAIGKSNNISNVSINNSDSGIYLFNLASLNIFTENNITNSITAGVYSISTNVDNNVFYNNFFNNSVASIIVATSDNIWNTTKTLGTSIMNTIYLGGNFWANTTGDGYSENCLDADNDYICDVAHTLDSTNIDYLPLTLNAGNVAPVIDLVTLNSSLETNTTFENLTANINITDADGDYNKSIVDWRSYNGSEIVSLAVLNMPFEAGTNDSFAKDYSTYEHNTTYSDATFVYAGGYDGFGAVTFNTTQTMNITDPSDGSLDFGDDGDFTISVWKKGYKAGTRLISKRSGATGYEVSMITGVLNVFVSDGTTLINQLGLHHFINVEEEWYHIAVVWDASENNMTAYVNGEFDMDNATETIGSISTDADFLIGANTNNFNGTIDDLLVFNRALSEEQILALYNNQTNILVSQETVVLGNYSVCATGTDRLLEGTETCSNSLFIENNLPVVNLRTPPNATSSTNSSWVFEYNVSDNDSSIADCTLYIDGANVSTNTSIIEDATLNFTYTPSVGTHEWSVYCVDSDGGATNSTIWQFTKSAIPVTTTPSTGGGGGNYMQCSPGFILRSNRCVPIDMGATGEIIVPLKRSFEGIVDLIDTDSPVIEQFKENFDNSLEAIKENVDEAKKSPYRIYYLVGIIGLIILIIGLVGYYYNQPGDYYEEE